MLHHRRCGVRHGLGEHDLVRMHIPGVKVAVALSAGVDQRLAGTAGAADGKLLERAAVTAHRVSLEVGQHQHRVIILDVLAETVLLQNLSVRDRPDHVRAFGIHQVHIEVLVPAVILDELAVGFGVVADTVVELAAVSGVALDDRSLDALHHRLPEVGTQEVLVPLLAGVHLHGHLSRKLNAELLVHLHNDLRTDLLAEIHFCFCHFVIPLLFRIFFILKPFKPD